MVERERAIATVEQILKKSANDTDITKALITYLDTPISDTLLSPAELFYTRPINTRLSMSMKPTPLTDQQKADLNDKRSAHLKPLKHDKNVYLPNQPIWFTDDNSDEWKQGYIDSNDTSPDSYWIINEKSDRRLGRNKRDIKPRHTILPQQRPQPQVPVRFTTIMIQHQLILQQFQQELQKTHLAPWSKHRLPAVMKKNCTKNQVMKQPGLNQRIQHRT